MARKQTPALDKPRKSRWRRRVLYAALSFFILFVLLLVLAPSLALNGFVERKAAKIAEARIGRPVVIEGVRVGWLKPIQIRRIELPPIEGENGLPAFSLMGVQGSFALGNIFRGLPVQFGEFEVGSIEGNLVRLPDGRWNVDAILENFPPSEAEPEEEEPAEPEPPARDEAPSFPLDFSRIEIKSMNFRVVDSEAELVAGYESGHFALTWEGETTPLEISTGGSFRAGDRMMPWSLSVAVDDWIDGEQRLRLNDLQIAILGGAGESIEGTENRVAGEFRLAASLIENDPGEFTGRLPIEPWLDWAKGLPQASELPDISGQLEMRAGFQHAREFQDFEADANLKAAAAVRMETDGEVRTLPEQTLEMTFSSKIDLEAQRVSLLNANIESAPFRAKLIGEDLHLDDFGQSKRLEAFCLADAGEAARLGAQFLHGEESRPLEAVFRAEANLLTANEGESRLAFEADFSPGDLRSLEPFSENPEWLNEPLDLSALGFTWGGELEIGEKNQAFDARVSSQRGRILKLQPTHAIFHSEKQTWTASTGFEIDGTLAFDEFLSRILGDSLDRFDSVIRLKADAQGHEEGGLTSLGALQLEGLRLKLPENDAPFEEAMTSIDWDVAFEPEASHLKLNRFELGNSFLTFEVNGEVSSEAIKDLRAEGRFDLNALSERLVAFLDLESPPAGRMDFTAKASGEVGKKIDATIKLETPEPLEYAQSELVMLSLPLAVDAGATVNYTKEEAESVDWSLSRFELGELVSASGAGRLGLGTRPSVDADLQAEVLFTPVTEMIDPVFWEQQELEAVIEGGLEIEMKVSGVVPGTEPVAGESLQITGRVLTLIEYLEALQGEMTVAAEGFSDQRDFSVAMQGTKPEDILYEDQSLTELALAQTSMGAAMGGLSIRSSIRAPAKGEVLLTLDALSIEEVQYADDSVEAQIPPVSVSGAVNLDPETMKARVDDVLAEIDGLASVQMSATYDGDAGRWSAKMQADAGPLETILDTVAFHGEGAPEISELAGTAFINLDFKGLVPDEHFDPVDGLPTEGRLTAGWDDLALRQGESLALQGGQGRATLEVAPGGRDLQGEFNIGLSRVDVEGLNGKALEPVRVAGNFRVEGMDRVDLTLEEMNVASLGFQTRATARGEGINAVLRSEDPLEPGDYLRQLDLHAEFDLEQSLEPLSGIADGFTASGITRVEGSLSNEAARVFTFVSSMEFEDVEAHLEGLMDMEGVTGRWTAGKTLPLRRDLMTPKSPAPGLVVVDLLHAIADPFDVESRGNAFRFEGFQSGFVMRAEMENLIGGPATTQASLVLEDGDPVLSGRMQLTGLDLGRLARQLRDLQGPEAEINGVAEFEWRVPESTDAGLLHGITLQAASSRIGKRAFKRMLEALDPEQEDPRIQKAITALSLGRPSGVEVELRDSLLTFGAELETLGGVKVPLPIIERQSLGDVEQVYQLEEFRPMIGMARTGLLLLLAEDFETFENNLNALEAAP